MLEIMNQSYVTALNLATTVMIQGSGTLKG